MNLSPVLFIRPAILWATGGFVLIKQGLGFLHTLQLDTMTLVVGVTLAILLGFAKGKFVLGKASIRNILRLQALKEPVRPIHVYPLKSWITIALMLLISISLTIFEAPIFARALVNLGIGMGLLVSSTTYLRYMNSMNPYNTPADKV